MDRAQANVEFVRKQRQATEALRQDFTLAFTGFVKVRDPEHFLPPELWEIVQRHLFADLAAQNARDQAAFQYVWDCKEELREQAHSKRVKAQAQLELESLFRRK